MRKNADLNSINATRTILSPLLWFQGKSYVMLSQNHLPLSNTYDCEKSYIAKPYLLKKY